MVFANAAALFVIVFLIDAPIAALDSRRPLPGDASIPTRLASGVPCYRVTYYPRNFGTFYGRAPEQFCLSANGTPARWRMAGRDSIDVDLPVEWFLNYRLRLSVRTDTLAGRAWKNFDTPDYTEGADARATPVP
jgi:hypothetical protein